MGDPGGQLTNCGEALFQSQLLLEIFDCREIRKQADRPVQFSTLVEQRRYRDAQVRHAWIIAQFYGSTVNRFASGKALVDHLRQGFGEDLTIVAERRRMCQAENAAASGIENPNLGIEVDDQKA